MAHGWMPDIGRDDTGDRVLVGLLGHGISASRTPRMHMEEGRAQGIDYDYRLIDLEGMEPAPDVSLVLADLAEAGFSGLNVTYPFKQAVIPHLDHLSSRARTVGAVNTIVFRDGQRFGHNTDCWGFAESFRRGLPGAARDVVLLLGAGGAGSAVATALLGEAVGRLLIHDPDVAMAKRLAHNLAGRFGPERAEVTHDLARAAAQADGIVNASPVGMEKLPGLPLPADVIATRHWVADVVYFPLETALLATARARGCAVLSGAGMALWQAVRAFELFTGRPADPARMQASFDSFT